MRIVCRPGVGDTSADGRLCNSWIHHKLGCYCRHQTPPTVGCYPLVDHRTGNRNSVVCAKKTRILISIQLLLIDKLYLPTYSYNIPLLFYSFKTTYSLLYLVKSPVSCHLSLCDLPLVFYSDSNSQFSPVQWAQSVEAVVLPSWLAPPVAEAPRPHPGSLSVWMTTLQWVVAEELLCPVAAPATWSHSLAYKKFQDFSRTLL